MKAKITALFASDGRVLGKSFSKKEGVIEVTSYPHNRDFDTEHHTIRSVNELHTLIREIAKRGGCLLKGLCHKDLSSESRAGSTDSHDSTDWICLDLDRVQSVETIEQFIEQLPKPFQNASYIVQYSSSMGIVSDTLSAHIFFLIKRTLASVLKTWLIRQNLENAGLRSELALARSGIALKWKLDISTCQNDKLIYIAPPTIKRGVKNTFKGERIQLVKKRYAVLDYDFAQGVNPTAIKQEQLKALNILRKAAGLRARRIESFKTINGIEVMKNVKGNAAVTDYKVERGFAYLQLNGGDSWGYYHAIEYPEVLLNFKGEPNYLISELDAGYYERAVALADGTKRARVSNDHPDHPGNEDDEAAQVSGEQGENGEGQEPWITLVGNNAVNSSYFGLRYLPSTQDFNFQHIGSRVQVKDYCGEHGIPTPEHLDFWTVGYDFADPSYKLDFDEKRINLYDPPPYMSVRKYPNVPKTIARVIKHVTGNDDEAYERFLNWNACVLQHRRVIGTAWLLSGTQGTGKGVYFNEIMSKLLGTEYVTRTTLPVFEKEFNAFMERALLVFVDEVRISELTKASTALSNLKQLITDNTVAIRKMRTDQYIASNHANFVFASNHHDSMEVDPSDRRFLIAPRQEAPLSDVLRITDIEDKVPGELERFAGYLLGRKADLQYARDMYHSSERTRLQHLTRDSSDEVIDAFRKGNASFFIDNAPDKELSGKLALDTGLSNPPSYETFLNHIMGNLNEEANFPRDMLEVVFFYICGITFKTPHKFTKFLGKRGLDIKSVRYDDTVTRGIKGLTFTASGTTVREWRVWLTKQKANIRAVPDSKMKSRSSN